jgi:hypothetical protein
MLLNRKGYVTDNKGKQNVLQRTVHRKDTKR